MPRESTDQLKRDDIADLVEQARDCAKNGRWSRAFASFVSADRLAPLPRRYSARRAAIASTRVARRAGM
jgi:hypothetical protein